MTASAFGKLMFAAGIFTCLYFVLQIEDPLTRKALSGLAVAVCGLQVVLVNHRPEK